MATAKSALNTTVDNHMKTLQDSDREAINQLLAVRTGAAYHDAFAMTLAMLSNSYPPYADELPGRHKKSSQKKTLKRPAK
jgi:hypothetical protein